MSAVEMLFLLLAGHALGDFVLQSEVMARGKNRHSSIHLEQNLNFPPWYYWLGAHSLVHGGIVYLITGSLTLGVIETLSHWIIDYYKCEEKIGLHSDQILHLGLKFAYVAAL